MALIQTELQKLSNTVKFETANPTNFTREVLTVNEAAAKTYKIGDIVGVVTATSKGKLAVETAVDGSKVFYGVVLEDKAVAATTDTKVLVLVRGPAAVSKTGIYLDSTYNDATKKGVIYAAMEAKGIQLLETA